MARYVKVSTIGAPPPRASSNADHRQLLERMREFWREKIDRVAPDRPDLIVLPEYCDIYHEHSVSEQLEYAHRAGEAMLDFFRRRARENSCYFVYPTLFRDDDGVFHNTTRVLDRCGEVVGTYNKYHVTIGEMEDLGVRCGSEAPIIECDFGRIACVTCFDLNFDELHSKYMADKPDLIAFSSLYHGGLMQAYWAYSCRAYFVSAIGIAGLRSAIISPIGETLASTTIYQDFVTAALNLDYCIAHLDYNREKLRLLKARYGCDVSITDPDLLGAVLIASEHTEKTAQHMADEFGIELIEEYFDRSQMLQRKCRSL